MFLYGLTFYLFPYDEQVEYTLALKRLENDSVVKTATYVVKKRYYKWLFAVQAPSFLSGEWMPEASGRHPHPNHSSDAERLGVILGQTAAVFCGNG